MIRLWEPNRLSLIGATGIHTVGEFFRGTFVDIRSSTVLPANRLDIDFVTADGLTLVGEVATPAQAPPLGTLLFLHPLPTAGGFMDSHLIRKASNRLPALAQLATFRFNFRGVSSPRGTSEGEFGEGIAEAYDLEAALSDIERRGLPTPWLVGWSFGTEVIIKHALAQRGRFAGAILLAPPLHRATTDDVAAWQKATEPLVVIVPEHDTFLPPEPAKRKFSVVPRITFIEVPGAKHLFVGENYTREVLSHIVAQVNPSALPLPTDYPNGVKNPT
jgi:alpha/beta superfamily hydrolase